MIDLKIDSTKNFYDPETLTGGDEEFKKTFLVFGGIPNQSITNFKIEILDKK